MVHFQSEVRERDTFEEEARNYGKSDLELPFYPVYTSWMMLWYGVL